MPFEYPSLEEQRERIAADIEARLPGADPRLRRSLLGALAYIRAGESHNHHAHIAWAARQVRPTKADDEILDEYATLYLEDGRLEATYATGDVEFSGNNGEVIPEGTEVETGDGTQYATEADATIEDGTATATITAVEPGEAGNQDEGVSLSLTSPIAGVESQATVSSGGIDGGADRETDDSLRTRIQKRLRTPPQGGAKSDYEAWALAAHPDVTRAWIATQENGPNSITVRFMTDGATSDGIPNQQVVDAVQAYIDDRRNVTAEVTVLAPTPVPYDYEIADLDPSTQAVKDAIDAEVADMIRRDSKPGGTILETHFRAAVSVAPGENDHNIVSPTDDKTHSVNEIAVPGTPTWS